MRRRRRREVFSSLNSFSKTERRRRQTCILLFFPIFAVNVTFHNAYLLLRFTSIRRPPTRVECRRTARGKRTKQNRWRGGLRTTTLRTRVENNDRDRPNKRRVFFYLLIFLRVFIFARHG